MGISRELYNLLENYLSGKLQRVVLNGKMSSWRPVLAGVTQESILGSLLFFIYINDLPNELKSHAKLFADDTSRFTIVKDKNVSDNVLNKDLLLISKWAYDWKMLFNSDPSKPAQEVLFSRKRQVQTHPVLIIRNIQVERVPYQKYLGIILDNKLDFKQHIDNTVSKVNKGISMIKELRHSLPLKSLVTVYKAFLRPLIDYGDIIYDQPQNEYFCEKLESVQYKVALAITGAIQSTSRDKIYHELGLETLKSKRWYKHLSCLFKIMNEEAPNYLINLIPKHQQLSEQETVKYQPSTAERIVQIFFSSSTLNDWFKLDDSLKNSESISIFKRKLSLFIRLVKSKYYNIFETTGLTFLICLRLGFIHLNE